METQTISSAARRFRLAAVTAFVVALAAASASAARAQDPDAEDFPEVDGNGLYSLPRSQDDIAEWRDGLEDIEALRFDAAVARLQRLLGRQSAGVVPDPLALDRFLGLRLAVLHTLRDLPPAGRAAYEKLARRESGKLYSLSPFRLSGDELRYLADSFPTSAAGLRARLRLGDLALERGAGSAAQTHYRAARDSMPAGNPLIDTLARRVEAAEALTLHAERGSTQRGGELTDALRTVLPDRGDAATGGTWPCFGGGYDGARPMHPPEGSGGQAFVHQIRAFGFGANPFAVHAVGDLGAIFVNDGLRVIAFDPIGQHVLWEAEGSDLSDRDRQDTERTVNIDMILAPAVSQGVVVASLQVPNDIVGARRRQSFNGSISIIEKIPSRRLFAFDRHTGKRLWAHWDSKDGEISERFAGHDSCGPPLVHGDTVYVATHDQSGAIAYYLAAYDVHTGAPKWRRLICSSQQEVNMFGNARQEFASGPLGLHGGVLFGTTNLGVCYAVDADDGEIRWITGYEVIPLPRTRLRDQERRRVFFANNPIVIRDGVMATTPLDSGYALGLDCETGARLWSVPFEGAARRSDVTIRWLLGAIDDEFIFAGIGVVAVRARPDDGGTRRRPRVRLVASPESLDEDDYSTTRIPRGAVTEDRIWFIGSQGGIRVFDTKGNRDPQMADLRARGVGNLLLTDGIAALARDGSIGIYTDVESLLKAARRQVDSRPDDPAAMLRLATLYRAKAGEDLDGLSGSRAVELFERGLAVAAENGYGIGTPVRKKLAQGLFQISFERARRAAGKSQRRGLELMFDARARAPGADEWLTAQQEILALLEDDSDRTLEELDRMRERFGPVDFVFRRYGRMPVTAFALWRSLGHLAEREPLEATARAQQLLERFGDLTVQRVAMRELAAAFIEELIAQHGRAVYADVEARAAAALESAELDAQRLRDVQHRYPHSDAARLAVASLLDVAVLAGDMDTAARSFREAAARGPLAPGILRRMQAVATACGNLELARALGRHLLHRAPDARSDYAPDGGRTYRAIVEALPPAPESTAVEPQLPVALLADIVPPNIQTTLNYLEVELAPGFPRVEGVPIYLMIDDRQVAALGVKPLPRGLDESLFVTPVKSLPSDRPIILCGSVLVLCEQARVRGVDYRTGKELWNVQASPGRSLSSLGVRDGVLHVFSEVAPTKADGGQLLGIEPQRGAILFRHVFDPLRDSVEPVATRTTVCAFDPGNRERAPSVERFDTVTGRAMHRTPLSAEVLRFLRLDGDRSYKLHNPNVQTSFFADQDVIYLYTDATDRDEDCRLVAIDADGRTLREWHGRKGTTIKMAASRGDDVVILERSLNHKSWLTVLDRRLNPRFEVDLGPRAIPKNWRASNARSEAPARLLIQSGGNGLTLHCIEFEGQKRRFVLEVKSTSRVLSSPILGPDFVAVPCARPGGANRAQLRVYTPRGTGALPGGRLALRLNLQRPVRMFQHGPFTVVETFESVKILGTREND